MNKLLSSIICFSFIMTSYNAMSEEYSEKFSIGQIVYENDYPTHELSAEEIANNKLEQMAFYASIGDALVTKMTLLNNKNKSLWDIPDDAGLLTFTSLKMALIGKFTGTQSEESVKMATSAWSGVSAGNMLLALGVANPLALLIGVVSGAWAYSDSEKIIKINKEKIEKLKKIDYIDRNVFIKSMAMINNIKTKPPNITDAGKNEFETAVNLDEYIIIF